MEITHAWAKLDDDRAALPLEEHGADVAMVFRRLLAEPFWWARLERCAGRPLSSRDLDRMTALAFLHDLGKTNLGFWERQFPGRFPTGHTHETAALFYARKICCTPVANRLRDLVEAWDCPDLFAAAMAHHGRPLEAYAGHPGNTELGKSVRDVLRVNRDKARLWQPQDDYDPLRELASLLDEAERRFPAAFPAAPPLPDSAAFVSLFCGLLTLADWLGSDTALFPVAGPHGAGREPVRDAAVAAAVTGRGLAAIETPPLGFAATFDLPGPRGIQDKAGDPGLGPVALIEAETGSGKTEAALWRWLTLRRAGAVDGLYFALPTRSAAVQLHGRVQAMLDRVFGHRVVAAVLAVPGYIRAGDAEGQALPDFGVAWDEHGGADGRWAAERPKRFLAARVAVGTVDQVLMAGLQLRHAHLRAAALSRNLLVVDEVHASDAFMAEVLGQVLRNHVALGGHALLLSATLTADARCRLLGVSDRLDLADACAVAYPALSGTLRKPEGDKVAGGGKAVALEAWPVIDDAAAIAARVVAAARAGASVLVVRNSVAGAVAVAQAVEALAPDLAFRVGAVATAHHGRFAPGDRRLLDGAVEAAFGNRRDHRGRVLCGTQTLEQSLDIDADLLITDLAPMDVLLQRIGRLHRHPGRERGAFAQAHAVVLVPAERDLSAFLGRVRDRHGLGPRHDGTGVYPDLLVLEATLRLVEANPMVSIPHDNRRLVEGALHPDVLDRLSAELGTRWINHAAARSGILHADRGAAQGKMLDLSAPFGSLLFRDVDEAVATRLGLRDRWVPFDPPLPGPFGVPVEQVAIPGWMAGNAAADTVPVPDGDDGAGARFRLGERRFLYGRWGLEVAGA